MRFKCKNCNYQFQSKRQIFRLATKLTQNYFLKNSLANLSKSNNKSYKWIRKQIDSLVIKPNFNSILPRKIRLVCDATYFGKRKDRSDLDGLLVFLDSLTDQIVWFKFLKNETNADY